MVDNCWFWLKSWRSSKNENMHSMFGAWANLRLENVEYILDNSPNFEKFGPLDVVDYFVLHIL